MKIAVLAWGSLVGEPRDLQAAGTFAPNGPLLPIEFCRVSADGRLTLVIDETFGAICTTYSASSALQDLDAAVENLRLREGMQLARGVGFVEVASGKRSDAAIERHAQCCQSPSPQAAPAPRRFPARLESAKSLRAPAARQLELWRRWHSTCRAWRGPARPR